MMRAVLSVGLVLVVAMVAASCGGPSAATDAPTQALPTETSSAPTATPAAPPTEALTEAPTEPPPTVEATATTPRETVHFRWAPGSVTPGDADDVAEIVTDLRSRDGIFGGTGDENVISIDYDPTVITVEEIIAIFEQIGHPVVLNE